MFVNGQRWIDLGFCNKVSNVLYYGENYTKSKLWSSAEIATDPPILDNILK